MKESLLGLHVPRMHSHTQFLTLSPRNQIAYGPNRALSLIHEALGYLRRLPEAQADA